ncbi:MAG: hypothetical protein V3V14_04910 [Saprospiraceae bacterium]
MIFLIGIIVSCTPDGPGVDSEIIFVEVIGMYEGQCANYTNTTTQQSEHETGTLSVYAANTKEAGIKISCARFDEYKLKVKTATSEKITFESFEGQDEVKMIYISMSDSLIITKTTNATDGIIFSGTRQ